LDKSCSDPKYGWGKPSGGAYAPRSELDARRLPQHLPSLPSRLREKFYETSRTDYDGYGKNGQAQEETSPSCELVSSSSNVGW
jgi:hypothetical protein